MFLDCVYGYLISIECPDEIFSNFVIFFFFFVVTCFLLQILLILVWLDAASGKFLEHQQQWQGRQRENKENIASHSCIHDQIIEQRGLKVYSVTPQVYKESDISKPLHRKGRALLELPKSPVGKKDAKQPIRIYLNYDAVGHSPDRDCRRVGDVVKVSVNIKLVYSVVYMAHASNTYVGLLIFLFLYTAW